MGNHPTKEHSNKYHRSTSRKNVHWEHEPERPHPPGQPLLVPASPEGHQDVVTIRWDPPISDGGAPITGYLVEHRRLGSPHWVRATPGLVTRCQLTLSGLEPGWRYQFRVSAENAAGRSDPSAMSEALTVTLSKGVATAPHFVNELQDSTALENAKVELSVRVTGTPTPKISWLKDGLEVFSGRRTKVVTDAEGSVLTSSLIIHQASLADEGEVKCTATNRAGHAVTKARLRMEAPPSIRLPRQYEDGLLFELGEVIRVKVSVAGRPMPRVSWLHNGEVMLPGPRFEIVTTDKGASLRVSEARRSDRGEYQVRAVNQLGEDVASFLVTVTDRPTPPGKAMVAMTLGRSVTLSWAPPDDDGGCKIGNYIVEYYRVGWDMWLKAATCRQLTTTLGDLIEGSEYKFRVKAENPYGVSDPGDESETVFIPDLRRGITDPPQRSPDGSENKEWFGDRKRPRDSEAEPEGSAEQRTGGGDGVGTPTKRRAPPQSSEVEDMSPIPSPVPRISREPTKSLSLPRTRSAAPGGAPRGDDAPEPPKRRNRSLSRGRGGSVSPEPPDESESYLPTAPDEMGVVKGRLFGIHLTADNVRPKRSPDNVGIEEVIYSTLPERSEPASERNATSGVRQSPIGGDEQLNLDRVNEYADKYEAKLREIERRQKDLEERARLRKEELELEEQKVAKAEKDLEERTRQKQRELEEQRAAQRSKQKDLEERAWQQQKELEEQRAAQRDKHSYSGEAEGERPRKRPLMETTEKKPASGAGAAERGQQPELLSPRSDDGSVAGDSSEFLLVLLPHSRATTEEREVERSDAMEALKNNTELSVAPPMSLSAPELGAIDPDIPFLRNAVSSTELLHERAMARFYQEVAEEEAEKARKRRMSIERRVSLERRLSIERKTRIKSRMSSVEESEAEDNMPVNFTRFAGARPSDSSANKSPQPHTQEAPVALEKPRRQDRVMTSEEREEAEFAALRERLSRANQDAAAAQARMRAKAEDRDEEDEEDEEYLDEEEEDEDDLDLEESDEEMPEEEPDDETYHPPRYSHRQPSEDEEPPPLPPHRSPSPPSSTFIPKSSTYTTMTEHDNVASTLLTKRHSPVKGDVKPKPILKKRGSLRRDRRKTPPSPGSKSPGSKSPGSKSPGSKSPGRDSPASKRPLRPLMKVKDKLTHKSNDSMDSDKSDKDRKPFSLFRPIKNKQETDGDRDSPTASPVRMRSKQARGSPDPGARRDSFLMAASPEANLGISAAEAARNKRGIVRKEPIKDEATKVVISHYSELVKEFGSANKHQAPKYLSYDELKARAENGSVEAVDRPAPQASQPPPATNTEDAVQRETSLEPRRDPTAGQPSRRDSSVAGREPSESRADSLPRRDPGAYGRDVRTESSASRREPSVARREPSVARRESSVSRRDSTTPRRDSTVSKRDSSVTRRDPSSFAPRGKRDSSVSKREPSASRRDTSVSRRDTSVSRRDTSVSRRDTSISRRETSVSRRDRLNEAAPVGRHRHESDRSLYRSHTSVASSVSTCTDDGPRTPEEEETIKMAEENVRSTISYLTDMGMFMLAVWLYVSRSELLAIPVLALLVYRQAKEELRKRTPAWLLRLAGGRGGAGAGAGAGGANAK